MKNYVIFIILFSLASFGSNCIKCHKKAENDLKESIHSNVNVDCSTCHNGNPEENSKEKAHLNLKKKFSKKEIAILCGNCHENKNLISKFNPNLKTDQLSSYKTSKHGIALFSKNDENVASCTDCHSYHKVLKPSNPLAPVYPLKIVETCGRCHSNKELMRKYGISGKEVDDYKKSVHFDLLINKNDLSAPTCDDCHGSHGATPPGLSSIKFVCGNCHSLNQEMFEESPHKKPWEENGFKYCEECHSNHFVQKTNDNYLNPEKGLCLNCHTKEDAGGKLMIYFYTKLKNLEKEIKENKEKAKIIENKGIFVEETLINLQEANSKLVRGRTFVHTFSQNKFDEVIKEGFEIINKEKKIINDGFKELSGRRKGLLIFSIFAILLAILIFLKIREMEKRKNG